MATVRDHSMMGTDLDPITRQAMDAFRRRRGVLLLLRAAGVAALVFITLTLILATIDYLFFLSDGLRWCASLGIWAVTAVAAWKAGVENRNEDDPLHIARHVESAAPQLREDLLSAVELSDPEAANGSSYFRRLLQSRVARRISTLEIQSLLPFRLVQRWVFSGSAVIALCVALTFVPSAQFGRRFARAAIPGLAIERASRTKVNILEPSPASGFVAQRDAVGVIAMVSGAEIDDVMLEWRSEDGNSGESPMTARFDASRFQPGQVASLDDTPSGPESIVPEGQKFAANLSVGSVPLEYRIIAGDAITLWHELTPLPRPRVVRYEKVYRLPKYAKLTDRTADEEHGDLEALQGTVAELTVTFDQPVETPMLRFGFGGAGMEMTPADESDTRFTARVSIKTSGQYQVDATSVRSGLNNPFSPSHTINPVLDTPPMIRWSADAQDNQLVSSLDVLELSATAIDDLPLERVYHEFKINQGAFQRVAIPMANAARELNLDWSWDLMDRMGDSSVTEKLSQGDLIKTRLVAIDRKGERVESRTLEMLVAGDGFNADRHDFLQPLADRSNRIAKWAENVKALAESMKDATDPKKDVERVAWKDTWKTLQAESVELIKQINQTLSETGNPANAHVTELTGRAILDVETRLSGPLKRFEWLEQQKQPEWESSSKRHIKQLGSEFNAARYQAERLAELARWRFALGLSSAIYSDVSSFSNNVERLVEDMPIGRMPRYITLVAGRLSEVDRLVERYQSILPVRTAQHLESEHWIKWSNRWSTQLENLIQDNAAPDQMAAVLRSLRDQSRDKRQHVIDSSITSEMIRFGRDVRKEMFYLSDLTRELNEAGKQLQQIKAKTEQQKNAEDAIESGLSIQWQQRLWSDRLSRLIVRATGQEKLNRSKLRVDLQYASDQNLFARAIKNVTAQGYTPYKEESPDKVLDSIGKAMSLLQAASDINAVTDNLQAIVEGERQPDGAPLRKLYHPTWYALQTSITERAVRSLRDARLDWQTEIEPIDQTRYNSDHQQAKQRLEQRRWSNEVFVSASQPLNRNATILRGQLGRLERNRQAAREVLRRYVLTISEQARQAAEAARKAEQEAEKREEENLKEEQAEATQKATETIQSLIDRANTSEITDQTERDIARDADAAAELIAEAVKEAKEQLKQSQASENEQQRNENLQKSEQKLDELAERLEQTAEHFEKIENGEDLAESREKLRQAEEELQARQDLEERYEQAEKMADAANQDPRELLRQLEEELKRNEEMQTALSDISKDLIEDAANNLDQASKKEEELNRKLESEDRAFAEKKRQTQLMLDEFLQRASAIRDRTLKTTTDAAELAQDRQSRDELNDLREQLSETIDQTQKATNDRATLDEIQESIDELKKSMEDSARKTAEIADRMQRRADEPVYKDEKQRKSVAQRMESKANQWRNEEVRAVDEQRKRWLSHEKQAGSRVRNLEQQKRNADNAANRAEQRLKRSPDDEGIQNELAKQEARSEQAERAAKEARETNRLAVERRKDSDQRSKQISSEKSEKLKKDNPAAQLAEQAARAATDRAEELARELQRLGANSDMKSEIRTAPETAESLRTEQQTVQTDVQDTADALERASRHEERMDKAELAEMLDQAARQTEAEPGQAAEEAAQQLSETASKSENAAQAGDALKEASEKMAEQSAQIRDMLGQTAMQGENQPSQAPDSDRPQQPQSADASQDPSEQNASQASSQQPQQGQPQQGQGEQGSPEQGSPENGSPGEAPKDARQMAQTLDELDRSLAAQGQDPSQPSKPSDPANKPNQGNEQSGSQGQEPAQGRPSSEGDPNSEGQNGSPQTAKEASPTLAQMLEQQMQQAARERMKSLQEAQQGKPGDKPSEKGSNNPQNQSGQGDPPGGDDNVDLMEGDILDGQWGDLRRRGVDDAAQGRGTRIPRGYTREVQAYFKALSKRAAQNSNSSGDQK